jgi:hypothetical protein
MIGDPSFEWDVPGKAPAWWTETISGGTLDTFHCEDTWGSAGIQSLRITGTGMSVSTHVGGLGSTFTGETATPASGPSSVMPTVYAPSVLTGAGYTSVTGAAMAVIPGLPYTFQGVCNNLVGLPSITINWLNASLVQIGQTTVTGNSTAGQQDLALVNEMAPAGATWAQVVLTNTALTSTVDAYWDALMFTQITTLPPYNDGDSIGWNWVGQAGDSSSVQIIISDAINDISVIDGVNIDPSTPNMAFNVYHSVDDSYSDNPTMTETDWEQKLWMRVPQVFLCTQAQTYAFPEPITAKYVKIEFTNLQSQTYNPGNFTLPISYKKFPLWVANFFIIQLEISPFTASQVTVQYNALDFAYNYYLDDLDEEPASPVVAPQGSAQQLTSYFSTVTTNTVDATTLAQINLILDTYSVPTGSIVTPGSMLSSLAANVVNTLGNNSTSESSAALTPVNYTAVSTLNREPMVFEQSLPVMYFFLTCRHAYQELSAPLQYNRAYFAGVNAISFIRNNYTVAADTPLYIETGSDTTNIQLTDFYIGTDGTWFAYDNGQ